MPDAEKPEKAILLPIRLSPEADRLLRTSEKAYQIGNLTARVLAAIEAVDLNTVKVEDRPKVPGKQKNAKTRQEYEITTVRMSSDVRQLLKEVADARETSMSALIDGAVRKFYKEKKPKSV